MAGQSDKRERMIDKVDREILAILAEEPRLPYSDISARLEEEGIERSSEAVRQRVSDLLEITTNFFLVRPDTHEREIMLVTVQTASRSGARTEVFDEMSTMDYWFVGSGFGTIDIYAIATVDSTEQIDELLQKTRTLEPVTSIEYFIETDRSTELENYLKVE